MTTILDNYTKKIVNSALTNQNKLVFATGVFDLLHREHINFLSKAKLSGDLLIVGLESDARVRLLKGPNRPINPISKRLKAIKQTGLVNHAFALPDQFSKPNDHFNLVSQLKPSILAVSSHSQHLDKKQAIMSRIGGLVKVVHTHNPQISTTILSHSHQLPSSRHLHPPLTVSIAHSTSLPFDLLQFQLNLPSTTPYNSGIYAVFIHRNHSLIPAVLYINHSSHCHIVLTRHKKPPPSPKRFSTLTPLFQHSDKSALTTKFSANRYLQHYQAISAQIEQLAENSPKLG